jgi:nitrogen fixation NifU-like protein
MQEMHPAQLDDLYQEVILDHYRNPRNSGEIPNPHLSSRGFNPFCGDEVVLALNLDADEKVESVAFHGQGCSISQASASILTVLVKNKSLAEAEALSQLLRELLCGKELSDDELDLIGDMEALQGVRQFPIRVKCALLPWATLDDGIADYRNK